MSHSSDYVRKVAVLGAGVMGAQIAAHLVNARIPTVLFELAGKDGDEYGPVNAAIGRLKKLKPAPLGEASLASYIRPANYDSDLEQLADCDVVIEAIAERMDWKKDLYEKVAPHIKSDAVFATNTSGLSINELSSAMPESVRSRFCGVHFFNPPRYMHLAEVIPGATTEPGILDRLETFLTTGLGKGVVRAKDTPNFIGNRIGVFAMLSAMHHTREFGLGFDLVDQLTGPAIGRPKSATYRTADVVGLDTMSHVIKTMADTLPEDPWHRFFGAPDWLAGLIEKGALGQKTGAGIYRKEGRDILVLDIERQDYVASGEKPADEVAAILKERDPAKKFAALRSSDHPQAQFLWASFRDLFHYCVVHLEDIADNARDVDLAIRWGYGYRQGPFETWQAAGWKQIAQWIEEDITAGKTMTNAALPEWVRSIDGVHSEAGSYSPAKKSFVGRSDLPVYQRQRFPDPVLGETFAPGTTVHEDDAVRIWHDNDDVLVLSFKTKMRAVSPAVMAGMDKALDLAEAGYAGLVIWQPGEPFSVGADLSAAGEALKTQGPKGLEEVIRTFQDVNVRLRQSPVPTVAAVRGMALGGGCEILMHCDRVVAALESYIGLVEVGVGLLPAGGGLAEFAMRAEANAGDTDIFGFLKGYFENIAMGKVSTSALEARKMGFLRSCDLITLHPHELLHVARGQVRSMADAGYRPDLEGTFEVCGRIGTANFKGVLTNMKAGYFISDHDYDIGSAIADCLSGGDVERGSQVTRQWILDLERKHFSRLAMTEKTQERIGHMLKTGKPLRN